MILETALVIVLLIILVAYANVPLFTEPSTSEGFDTYHNHDFGAYDVYNNPANNNFGPLGVNTAIGTNTPRTVDDAALQARYEWSEKDPIGDTVYDKYYDSVVKEKNWGDDYEYGYRDLRGGSGLDNVYDTKFSTLGFDNQLSNYNPQDMFDPNPVQFMFNGQRITLSQKQY